MSLASKMVQAAKFQAVQVISWLLYIKLEYQSLIIFSYAQARIYEGREPIQFFVIFQSLQVFKVCFNLLVKILDLIWHSNRLQVECSILFLYLILQCRVALALDTRTSLMKTVMWMTLTLVVGLHCSGFRAQDQKTCKHFKSMQYVQGYILLFVKYTCENLSIEILHLFHLFVRRLHP